MRGLHHRKVQTTAILQHLQQSICSTGRCLVGHKRSHRPRLHRWEYLLATHRGRMYRIPFGGSDENEGRCGKRQNQSSSMTTSTMRQDSQTTAHRRSERREYKRGQTNLVGRPKAQFKHTQRQYHHNITPSWRGGSKDSSQLPGQPCRQLLVHPTVGATGIEPHLIP